jgi:hypothetical protein
MSPRPSSTLANAMVPATVGAGSGMALGDAAAEGEAATRLGAADGELDAVVLVPPHAASPSIATKTSSVNALATVAPDPRDK